MSEKLLTDAVWNAFVKGLGKGRDVKDGPLLKAMQLLERSAKSSAAEQSEALAGLTAALGQLRKEHKADKSIVAQLDQMDKAVAVQRKAIEQLARDEQAAEHEEESPALLTTKMLALVKEVQRGEVTMPAMIAVGGKRAAVLISRKAIPGTRSKLLKEYLQLSGGVRVFQAECTLENQALTFIVADEVAGLAKLVKAALLEQTELRVKVRVRGLDPSQVDEDGDEVPPGSDSTATPTPTPQPDPGNDTADAAEFQRRHQALQGALAAALKANHPQAGKLRAVDGFAQEKAGQGQWKAALQSLQALEALLAPAPQTDHGVSVALKAWRDQRDAAVKTLRGLAEEVAASGDPDAAAIQVEVSAVLKQLTAEPGSAAQAQELRRWLVHDDVVADVSDLAQDIKTPLLKALDRLDAAYEDALTP